MPTNGKGDAPRPTNYKRFSENWDEIDWRRHKDIPASFTESMESLQKGELEEMFDDKGNLNH